MMTMSSLVASELNSHQTQTFKSKKMNLKMDAKNDAEKESKMTPKGSQNDARMDVKICEKSMRFRNLRSLVFLQRV